MIGVPAGLLYSNFGEWLAHKYILHGLGRRKDSWFAYHWHDHHRVVRRNHFVDPAYARTSFRLDPRTKELLGLAAIAVVHAPLFPVAPFFVGTVWYSTFNYYRVHRKAHLDPEWAREYLPWHWDHHMAPNQDANWCVSKPWADWILGTRRAWLGTPAEQSRAARDAQRASSAPMDASTATRSRTTASSGDSPALRLVSSGSPT